MVRGLWTEGSLGMNVGGDSGEREKKDLGLEGEEGSEEEGDDDESEEVEG